MSKWFTILIISIPFIFSACGEEKDVLSKWDFKIQMKEDLHAEVLAGHDLEKGVFIHLFRFASENKEEVQRPIASFSVVHAENIVRIMSLREDENGNIHNYFDIDGDGVPELKKMFDNETGKIRYYSLKASKIEQ